MTINRLMQLSAGHLTPETWTWLDHETGRGRFAPPAPVGIVRGGQVCNGWFVFADEDPDERVIPADLVAVILHARKAGCGFLLFDCDQIPLEDLPIRHPDFTDRATSA